MMTGLFSAFDPSNSTMNMNWLMLATPLFMAIVKSMKSSKNLISMIIPLKALESEVGSATKSMKSKETSKMIIALFIMLATINAWSLIPSSFSPTAQISINLPLAATAWMTSMTFFAIKKTKNTLAHLVPSGTPPMLMALMVLIEITSNVIRPITLSVRLTANMVAGHILISLTEQFIQSGKCPVIISAVSISLLTILESGVALIQSYIFCTLITMYLAENH